MGISKDGNYIRLTGKDAVRSGEGYATSMAGPRGLDNIDINKVSIRRSAKILDADAELFDDIKADRRSIKQDSKEYHAHIETSKSFADSLNPEEKDAIKKYTNIWYKNVSSAIYGLPRPYAVTQIKGDERITTYKVGAQDPDAYKTEITKLIGNLNSALNKAPVLETPRMLYRAFIIHDENGRPLKGNGFEGSITDEQIDEFVDRYFPVGLEFYRKMPTSTTVDPRVAVENFLEAKEDPYGKYSQPRAAKNKGFVIEYLTKHGAPISKEADTAGMGGSYEELEVLLASEKKFRVVNVHKKVNYWIHMDQSRYNAGFIRPGAKKKKITVTVIQVVDAD